MISLSIATAFFVSGHFVLSSVAVRSALSAHISDSLFRGLYSLVALLGLGWMIYAYNHAPFVVLWPRAAWLIYLPVIIMPVAFVLLAGGAFARNPMAMGRSGLLQSTEPKGLLKVTRHPTMWGIALWAMTHVLANGDLAATIFFAGLLVLALGGAAHIDQRRRHADPQAYARFSSQTTFVPFAGLLRGRISFVAADVPWMALGVGLVLYVGFLLLHAWLFGASPWPP